MKRQLALLLLTGITLTLHTARAQDKEADKNQPAVSGTTQGNVGCVILEQHTPIKGKLLFAGVLYARTEYRVLETFNYNIGKQKFTGPGEVKELNDLAAKDKIKLVSIPAKHTPEQLEQARRLCKE
jgi:hypothetical protein